MLSFSCVISCAPVAELGLGRKLCLKPTTAITEQHQQADTFLWNPDYSELLLLR
jgi:hypothetical protein